MKMWKVYDNDNDDNDNDNNDDDGQRTNFDQKSSLEPSAQVSLKKGAYFKHSQSKHHDQRHLHNQHKQLCEDVREEDLEGRHPRSETAVQ